MKNKLALVFFIIIAVIALAGCKSDELTRDIALDLLRKEKRLPKTNYITVVTGKRVFTKELSFDNKTGNIIPEAPNPGHDTHRSLKYYYDQYQSEGLIRYSEKEKVIDRWPAWTNAETRKIEYVFDIEMLPAGRKIFKESGKDKWQVPFQEVDIEITAISNNEEGTTAIVEYVVIEKLLVDQAIAKKIHGDTSKIIKSDTQRINMRKFDTGWRIYKE